ncbi:expressed protein, partial [Phakopsora pachyrhizi]
MKELGVVSDRLEVSEDDSCERGEVEVKKRAEENERVVSCNNGSIIDEEVCQSSSFYYSSPNNNNQKFNNCNRKSSSDCEGEDEKLEPDRIDRHSDGSKHRIEINRNLIKPEEFNQADDLSVDDDFRSIGSNWLRMIKGHDDVELRDVITEHQNVYQDFLDWVEAGNIDSMIEQEKVLSRMMAEIDSIKLKTGEKNKTDFSRIFKLFSRSKLNHFRLVDQIKFLIKFLYNNNLSKNTPPLNSDSEKGKLDFVIDEMKKINDRLISFI